MKAKMLKTTLPFRVNFSFPLPFPSFPLNHKGQIETSSIKLILKRKKIKEKQKTKTKYKPVLDLTSISK